nr:putative proline iminopeptidase [Quercus suber]
MTLVKSHQHEAAFGEGYLQVSQLHRIHFEQYGNRDGKTVIFVHGGPGGSASYAHTAFFDPEVYRVVLFDQRGAGKSTPAAETRENTSQLLVSDMEVLREHCGVSKWSMVFGGSWGSTLSLLYAMTHPECVGSLVLRGIFTLRKAELDFSCTPNNGAAHLFPEHFREFQQHLDPSIRHAPRRGYYNLVTSEDYDVSLTAAKHWNRWHGTLSKLVPDADGIKNKSDVYLLQHAKLETLYTINGGFMEEGYLLNPANLAKISHIPCHIVSGRYDMLCPPQTAWELHKGLPLSTLDIIPTAGHVATVRYRTHNLFDGCADLRARNLASSKGSSRSVINMLGGRFSGEDSLRSPKSPMLTASFDSAYRSLPFISEKFYR